MSLNYIIQIASASASLIASMVLMIMINQATLSTPYRRLIFGLSTADVIHSLGMATGPFASPKGIFSSPWAFGNTETCTLNGFFNICGLLGVALYLLSLSVYFFFKLNRRMTDSAFCEKVEIKMHSLVVIFILSIGFSALFTTSLNPIPKGAVCQLARFPTGCGVYPEKVGECTRGTTNQTMILIYLVYFGVLPLSLLGVSVFMILLIRSSLLSERMYTLDTNNPIQHRSPVKNFFNCIFCCYFEHDRRDDESNANYMLRLHRRETIIQASLYIGSFLLTNLFSLIIVICSLMGIYERPIALSYIMSFLYPLIGFFNILIYCRPKVQWFRLTHPEISWLQSFFLVVKAGGEVPSLPTDPNASHLCCFCPRQVEVDRNRNQNSISWSVSGEGIEDSFSGRDEYLSEISLAFPLRERNQDNVNTNNR